MLSKKLAIITALPKYIIILVKKVRNTWFCIDAKYHLSSFKHTIQQKKALELQFHRNECKMLKTT